MSGTQYNKDPYQVRPEHRLHNSNEPLQSTRPTTTGVTDTGMPSTSPHHDPAGVSDEYNTTQSRAAAGQPGQQYDTTQGRAAAGQPGQPGQQYDTYFTTSPSGNRPLNVKPTPQGGVAYGGQSDLPLGYADLGDKIIGKTQKVVGKMANNPDLHQKGELRESGGRAAVHGLARAPHD